MLCYSLTSFFVNLFVLKPNEKKANSEPDVNRHILNTCDLHRLIDQTFASSTFGKHVSELLSTLTF